MAWAARLALGLPWHESQMRRQFQSANPNSGLLRDSMERREAEIRIFRAEPRAAS